MTRARTVAVTVAALSAVTLCGPGSSTAEAAQADAVTYAEQIAPILNARCVTCHRPGAIGPFSLTTYAEVEPRAGRIAAVTQRRYMPPWKPAPGFGTFRNDRRLSDADIDLIRRWVSAGAPEGDPGHLPPPPAWPDGWQLGQPDLVVTMPDPYFLPARGEDVYRNFAVAIPIEDTRFVTAIELRPDTTRGIHHARIMIDRGSSARRLDDDDVMPGYDPVQVDRAESPDGHFLGWAPGARPSDVPDRLAWRLDPGTDLVLKMHLLPRGEPEAIQVAVGLFFADAPPTETPVVVQLGSQTIDIPAGAAAHIVEDAYRLPVDVDVLAIYPHAHYLGKEISCVATLPDGTQRWLIQINDWDFNWQDEYRYAEPVRLPSGSTLAMRYLYDNSADNPRNPSRPPRRVRFGPGATDEMAELMLQVVPVDAADLTALTRDVARKVAQIVLDGAEKRLADDPANPARHEELAVRLVATGRVDDAVAHLEDAIRLAPGLASAQYNLGTALVARGETDAAVARYRRALALDPNHAGAHNNLGGLLQLTGHPAEAARHYRRTVQIDPTHPGAHYNLGNILLAESRFQDAEAAFRRTLAVRPADPAAHTGLGRALFGQGKLAEAIEAYRAALRIDPDQAPTHRHLGDALRGQGKLGEADGVFARAREIESRQR